MTLFEDSQNVWNREGGREKTLYHLKKPLTFHNVSMFLLLAAVSDARMSNTCGRFAGTHGGVLGSTHGGFSACHTHHTTPHNYHQVKRLIKRNRQHVLFDLLSNFKMGKIQCFLW